MTEDCRRRNIYRVGTGNGSTTTVTVIGGITLQLVDGDYYEYLTNELQNNGFLSILESRGQPAVLESSFLPEGCEENEENDTKYDCLNGTCVTSTQYNTPGIYPSLTECQTSCSGSNNNNECPPGMVCITSSEWSQIQGLAAAVKSKHCK